MSRNDESRSPRVPLARAFESEDAKRAYNRRMFAVIAPRYDLVTRVLSYGQDQRWKRRLVRLAAPRPGERALDLACGTGDIALALAAEGASVTGLDLTRTMLRRARGRDTAGRVTWLAGDMQCLPFDAGRFDLVTAGYGLRNVPGLDEALAEVRRVLRKGGRFVALDFDRPGPRWLDAAYRAYLSGVGAALGLVLHRDPDVYRYIAASLARYPGAAAVADRLRRAGFDEVSWQPLLGGLMALHVARVA
jgi:demethylmenaquinone methyltransferase/2-methoxy-6-polyprenyl-1,4-benzoquinol methylase